MKGEEHFSSVASKKSDLFDRELIIIDIQLNFNRSTSIPRRSFLFYCEVRYDSICAQK